MQMMSLLTSNMFVDIIKVFIL